MAAQALIRAPGDEAAPLALPAGFQAALLAPLLARPERARLAVTLLGAPLVHAVAERLDAALDRAALKAAAQRQTIAAKAPRERLLKLTGALANAGLEVMAIKGLATAHALYPHPALRLLPDADILVRREALQGLVARLRAMGFASVSAPETVRRWGALTAASFAPVAPPDGRFLVDVHVAIDDPPAALGLTTERLFARARTVATPAAPLLVPAPEHAYAILALHAFRDFYEPRGLKSLVDAALLLDRHRATMDWDEVERVARAGRFVKRVVFYRELLGALGLASAQPFAGLAPAPFERRLLARLAANLRTLGRLRTSDATKLACEALLYDSPAETLRWNLRRLGGLVRPRSHALPGLPHV